MHAIKLEHNQPSQIPDKLVENTYRELTDQCVAIFGVSMTDRSLNEIKSDFTLLSKDHEGPITDWYHEHTGRLPKRMETFRKVAPAAGFAPKKEYTPLERQANVDDKYLKLKNDESQAPFDTQEGVGNLFDHIAEQYYRKGKELEIMNRTRAEWKELERQYTISGNYTLRDFYDDWKTRIEKKKATWADYQEERKKWRTCKHRFCLELFPVSKDHFKSSDRGFEKYVINEGVRQKDSRYCCKDHRYKENDAKKRFENPNTPPTYLPESVYRENLERYEMEFKINSEISVTPVEDEILNKSPKVKKKSPQQLGGSEATIESNVITYTINTTEEEIEKQRKKIEKSSIKRVKIQ